MEFKWVNIPGYPGYKISKEGLVLKQRGDGECFYDRAGRRKHRYMSVRLYDGKGKRRHLLLHKLVFEVFRHPVPPGFHVDHIDRNIYNNHIDNLRCISVEENLKRRLPPTGNGPVPEVALEENI